MKEWQRSLGDTFGSQERLWDDPDELWFDRYGREPVGAAFRLPDEAADTEDCARVPAAPALRPGGLRAEEVTNSLLSLRPHHLRRLYAPGASPCARLNALAKANSEVYPTRAAMDLKGASVSRSSRAAVVSRHQVR